MRISAQSLSEESSYRRKIFDDNYKKANADNSTVVSYVKGCAEEFLTEILSDLEVMVFDHITAEQVIGFDANKDYSTGAGFVRIHAVLRSGSNNSIRLEAKMPLYRGEFLRPTVASLNGNVIVLSKSAVLGFISRFETHRPKLNDFMKKNQVVTHTDNIERGLFSPPQSNNVDPIYDPKY